MSKQSNLTARSFIVIWIQGLRSGEFRQGKDFLKRNNRESPPEYCSLGVACELWDPTRWFLSKNRTVWMYAQADKKEDHSSSAFLPKDLESIITPLSERLLIKFPEVGTPSTVFMHLNDSKGYSFAKIADEIEEVLDEVYSLD